MNINNYVSTLKSVIDKEDVLSALAAVRQDLNSKTQPIVDTSAAAFKTIKLKSKEAQDYDQQYRNGMKLGHNANVMVDIQSRLRNVDRNLDFLREMIEKHMPETVAQANIDRRSATMLQLVDTAAFAMRFVRRFVETMVVYETQAVGMYEDYEKNNLSKGEAEWVRSRFGSFLIAFQSLSTDPGEFRKKFESIPHVNVDLAGDDIAVFGKLRLDPYQMGFIPVNYNPLFIVGKWIAEFQAWRYKEAQEDLIRIQRRILLLEESVSGKSNPKIEKEIDILRDKASDVTYRLNKAEEEIK